MYLLSVVGECSDFDDQLFSTVLLFKKIGAIRFYSLETRIG